MKQLSKLLLTLTIFCDFGVHHLDAQPCPVVNIPTNITNFAKLTRPTDSSQATRFGIAENSPNQHGLSVEMIDHVETNALPPMPETNGVVSRSFIETTNLQKFISYFAPYAQIIVFNLAATLLHEIGHSLIKLAATKQWSKIWLGERFIEGVDRNDPFVYLNPKNFNKPLVSNILFSLYLPDEYLFFQGMINTPIIENKIVKAIYYLMGPTFGALFSWFMLQHVQQDYLKYAAKLAILGNVAALLVKDTDGFYALKALNVQTEWMQNENIALLGKVFIIVNLEHYVDIAMFCKIIQAKTEAHRMIALIGQSAFKVLIPFTFYYIKEFTQHWIDHARNIFKQN